MKFLLLSLFVSLPAHAYNVIEISPNTSVKLEASTIRVMIDGSAAEQLFDALAVQATPSWEDTLGTDKSAAGIYCHNEGSSPNRYSSCEIDVSRTAGVVNAVANGTVGTVLSFSGAAAKTIYDNLAASETQMDAEGYTFEKVASGFLCQSHFRSTYDCVTWVDPAKGIMR